VNRELVARVWVEVEVWVTVSRLQYDSPRRLTRTRWRRLSGPRPSPLNSLSPLFHAFLLCTAIERMLK